MITTIAELEALYGPASPRSIEKELHSLSPEYRAFVEASPFVVIATAGPEGLDCSPKGDAPGFVQILDDQTLAIPDRPGNNRIDNLRNIIRDPRISVLFMVPGVGETLRVNGRGAISAEPGMLARFPVGGKLPKTVILVTIESVYVHCPKAFLRSHLWETEAWPGDRPVPTLGQMLQSASGGKIDAQAYDRAAPARNLETLY
ncbi:pyridoxamine 5'-phosphate oxidase family protein [Acidisoma sp. C75]